MRYSSTAAIARSAWAGSAAPDRTAHDWAIESIRHSALAAEPSGVPSSKNARRYQSPSQPWRSSARRSVFMCPRQRSARGLLAARFRERREGRQRRVQEPAQPDALAPALVTDPVHPVVPVARPDERQPVRAEREAPVDRRRAVVVERRRPRPSAPAGSRRRPGPAAAAGPSRYGTTSSRIARRRRSPRGSGRPRTAARAGRPRSGSGPLDRSAGATSAGRRPRGTGGPRRAAGARGRCRASRSQRDHVLELVPEPVRAAGLVERASAPTAGRRASGRAASR